MNINAFPQAQTQKSTPSFGAINLCSGSREVIKSTIVKPKQVEEFGELYVKQYESPIMINLFGDSKNRLSAKIFSEKNQYSKVNELSQRLFETTLQFIRRCCKLADKRLEKEKNATLSIDDIIKIMDNN